MHLVCLSVKCFNFYCLYKYFDGKVQVAMIVSFCLSEVFHSSLAHRVKFQALQNVNAVCLFIFSLNALYPFLLVFFTPLSPLNLDPCHTGNDIFCPSASSIQTLSMLLNLSHLAYLGSVRLRVFHLPVSSRPAQISSNQK